MAMTESAPAAGTRSFDHRRERIRVQTERHEIEGYVTLARDGFRSRVSDMLNASERDFLTLTEATVTALDGSSVEGHRFLAVARRHIVFAVVVEADGGRDEHAAAQLEEAADPVQPGAAGAAETEPGARSW